MNPESATAGLEFSRWQRMLLPGAMVDGPSAGRSLRDWLVDAAVFVIAVGFGILSLTSTLGEHSAVFVALDLLLGIAAIAALWFRRQYPRAVAAFVLVAAASPGSPAAPRWSPSSTPPCAASAAPWPGSPSAP